MVNSSAFSSGKKQRHGALPVVSHVSCCSKCIFCHFDGTTDILHIFFNKISTLKVHRKYLEGALDSHNLSAQEVYHEPWAIVDWTWLGWSKSKPQQDVTWWIRVTSAMGWGKSSQRLMWSLQPTGQIWLNLSLQGHVEPVMTSKLVAANLFRLNFQHAPSFSVTILFSTLRYARLGNSWGFQTFFPEVFTWTSQPLPCHSTHRIGVRLFYSKPYLTRLEELTREVSLGFTFPNGGGTRGEVGHSKMMKMLEDVVRIRKCGRQVLVWARRLIWNVFLVDTEKSRQNSLNIVTFGLFWFCTMSLSPKCLHETSEEPRMQAATGQRCGGCRCSHSWFLRSIAKCYVERQNTKQTWTNHVHPVASICHMHCIDWIDDKPPDWMFWRHTDMPLKHFPDGVPEN